MQPKHMLAHAVAISLVIALVVYLSTSLGGSIIDVPAKYRAEYSVQWLDGSATYKGEVSVDSNAGVQSYKFEHKNGSDFKVVDMKFSKGFLYAEAFGEYASQEKCIGRFTPLGVADKQVTSIADTMEKMDSAFTMPGYDCAGSVYAFSAFDTNYFLCVVDRSPKWVAGDEFVLTIDKIVPDEYVEFTPSAAVNNSYCIKNGTWIGEADVTSRRLRQLSAEEILEGPPMPKKMKLQAANVGGPIKLDVDSEGRQLGRKLAYSRPKVCFIHGMGNDCSGPSCTGRDDSSEKGKDYWGNDKDNMGKLIPNADQYYLSVNSRDRGYDNAGLQNDVREFIKKHKCTHVFGHSMAGPTLSVIGAKFYALQTPFRGSWGANKAGETCGKWYSGLKIVAEFMGFCDGGWFNGRPSPCLKSLYVAGASCSWKHCEYGIANGNTCGTASMGSRYNTWAWCSWGKIKEQCCNSGVRDPRNAGPRSTFESNVNSKVLGSMCGVSGYGLGGAKGVGLEILNSLAGYGESADGMVSYSSCRVKGEGSYSGRPSNKWYRADINHQDGTGLSGEGSTNSKKPRRWMRNMVKNNPVTNAANCPIPNECTPQTQVGGASASPSCDKNAHIYERLNICPRWKNAGLCWLINRYWPHLCPCSC